MKKGIALVVIFAVFMIAYLFLGSNDNVRTKTATHEAAVPEATDPVVDTQSSLPSGSATDALESASLNKTRQLEPEIEKAVRELVNTSHEGLVEEATENGVSIDLRGRFRTAPVATINDKGELVVQDYTSAP